MSELFAPPCYKYIVRNISTPEERYVYSKNYFSNLDKHHISQDEQLALFSSIIPNKSCGASLSYNGVILNADDYRNHIMESADIQISKSCQSYYKSVVSAGKNSVCSMCRYSKTYCNNEYPMECSVLKYLAASREHLLETIEFDDFGEVFRSVVDVAQPLQSDKAGVISLLKVAYSLIMSQPDSFFTLNDMSERLESLNGKVTIEATKNPNIKDIQQINFKAVPIAWSQLVSDVCAAKDIEIDDVKVFYTHVFSTHIAKSSKTKKNKKSNSAPLLDLLRTAQEKETTSIGQNVVIDTTTISADASLPDELPASIEIDDSMIPDNAWEQDVPDEQWDTLLAEQDIPDSAYNDDEESEYTDDATLQNTENLTTEDTAMDNASNEAVKSELADNENNGEEGTKKNDTASEKLQPPAHKKGKKGAKYQVPALSDGSFIFKCDVNKRVFKSYAYSYLDFEEDIFNVIKRSKILPLEIVFDEDGVTYIYIFVRSQGRFYYCVFDTDVPNTLQAMLRSKSIRKICYQPYYLYSLCKLFGYIINEVFSLYSMDKLLHQNAMPCMYNDFFEIYRHDYKYTVLNDSGFTDFDTLCCFLQIYIQLQATMVRSIDKDSLKEQQCIDEVLGTSYLRILNLKSNDTLFDIEGDGELIYNEQYNPSARHEGFFVTYSIDYDDAPDISRKDLYMMGLADLSSKGRISKLNIQLVTMSENSMILFIGIREYELVITLLQKFYNRYANKKHMERFTLSAYHERSYLDGAKRPLLKNPKSYEEAMDRLITSNASVDVSKEHITIRRKNETKVRKKQNEKFIPGGK